jgi:hypothetical protein
MMIEVQNNLDTNVPSWSTHPAGFTINLKWITNGGGWGTTDIKRKVIQYHERFNNQTICGGITQMGNSSQEVVWLRGGGNYRFRTSRNSGPQVQSTAYTDYSGQTVAPTSSAQNSVWNSASGAEVYYTQNVYASSNIQSPIFYDSDDTGYYGDFASTSRMNSIVFDNLRCSVDQNYGFLGRNVYADTINGRGSDALELNYYDGGEVHIGSGYTKTLRAGTLYSSGASYGTIFYDTNDTSYYGDFNDQSRFLALKLGNQVTFNSGGTYPLQISSSSRYQIALCYNNSSYYPWLVNDSAGGYEALVFHFNGIGDRFYFNRAGNMNASGNISAGGSVSANNGMGMGDVWGYGGIYRNSGDMMFGVESGGWRFHYQNNQKVYIGTDGNIWMAWAGDYISNLLAAKQNASTAITTSNIGSQSVNYASTAGNANSISAAVGGAYTWTATNYFRTNNGGYAVNNSSSPSLQAYSDSNNSAFMSFHKGGYYAVNFGLDADNWMRIGGWSASSNRWQLNLGTGDMYAAGDITAYSDARVKTNILTIEKPLEKTLSLRGVTYTRTDSEDKKTKMGVIAQEVLEIIPEVVNQDNNGTYSVAYGNMVGLLIESIKEQQKQIEDLKKQLNALTK